MRTGSHAVTARAALSGVVTLAIFAGCASARLTQPTPRIVSPTAWASVVDCVMLSARASNFFADFDETSIVVTPGVQPFGPYRPATRATVLGRVHVTRAAGDSAVLVTTEAFHWAAQAFRRDSAHASGPAWTVARQLDAQCLAGYPAVATR